MQLLSSEIEAFCGDIAALCHEANRGYCQALGDNSQLPWDEAPDWQRKSAINGVKFHMDNPDATPESSHDNWLAEKQLDGWTYGLTKDADKKTHPCFTAYGNLPVEQRAKDYIFAAIVKTATRRLLA